jgi:hypothetical protein
MALVGRAAERKCLISRGLRGLITRWLCGGLARWLVGWLLKISPPSLEKLPPLPNYALSPFSLGIFP